ncbi:MAG: ThuA domain-containing protein, partial [Halobacteriales archaeon]|nr:ThuA domain-containing protein [Halobacteriales archaeon]
MRIDGGVSEVPHPVSLHLRSVNAMLSRLILCTILAVFVLGVASFRPQDSHTARVLVFSKTDGYRHASIEAGQDAFRTFADEHDLDVTFTEDASLFQEDTLKQYHVVVFLNTTQDVLDEEQQRQFERFIKAGGGYVGIHSAADTEYEWPWYGRLVGAYFDGHPNDPNVREGVISVVDSSHMSTQELPDPWVRQDEWYDYRDRNPEVHVLLTVDETTYKTEEENPSEEPHPIS